MSATTNNTETKRKTKKKKCRKIVADKIISFDLLRKSGIHQGTARTCPGPDCVI